MQHLRNKQASKQTAHTKGYPGSHRYSYPFQLYSIMHFWRRKLSEKKNTTKHSVLLSSLSWTPINSSPVGTYGYGRIFYKISMPSKMQIAVITSRLLIPVILWYSEIKLLCSFIIQYNLYASRISTTGLKPKAKGMFRWNQLGMPGQRHQAGPHQDLRGASTHSHPH